MTASPLKDWQSCPKVKTTDLTHYPFFITGYSLNYYPDFGIHYKGTFAKLCYRHVEKFKQGESLDSLLTEATNGVNQVFLMSSLRVQQ